MECSGIVLPADRRRRVGGLARMPNWLPAWVSRQCGLSLQAPPPGPRLLNRSFPTSPNAAACSMRFAATPEFLPPDPHRDNFYNTRYADKGPVKCPNWYATQGLYGLGWKTPDTESVYPFFYGMPGQSTVDSSSRPWRRPAAVLPGARSPIPAGRDVLPDGQLCPDLRSRPDCAGTRPLSLPVLLQLGARRLSVGGHCHPPDGRRRRRQRSTCVATRCGFVCARVRGSAAIASRRPRHERLDPRHQVLGLGRHAFEDQRIGPELQPHIA